ncbi:respiratory chain complex I subunit 1 family protein [Dendrosporobacter sp. 1207_IL3150]|uniref:respiratory chain complex I subunit 1 family protein n=1 Tax=Dendrosporobacter sp. 1207_IL3150 TaxID=3084054 RepID=UPI002FDB5D53
MFEQMLWGVLQVILLIMLAPLVQGFVKKVKARLQNRVGPGIFQPYYDIIKYLKKDAVVSNHASWLTTSTPYLTFTVIIAAGLFVPTIWNEAPLGVVGDIIVIIYLFALARFFTALSALDAGSSFGGMGSSRDMALSAIAEPALFLAVVAVLLEGGTTKLGQVITQVAEGHLNFLDPAYGLAFLAMLIVVITETGRIPVDNPDTHLELTMIHEGMLLEYSGRYLGLMVWASYIKQLLILTLFIDLFFPWGIATTPTLTGMFYAAGAYLLKLLSLGTVLAFIETAYAKVRLFQVPKLLASSMALSLLAIIVRVVR